MSPRIEPTLEPAAGPGLRIDPAHRAAPPPPASGIPLASWLFGTLLGLLVLLLGAVVGLRWLPPPTTSYMLQSPVKPVQYRWVPADGIADTMRRAVVAAEDQKFWTHHGFDLDAIEKARQYNLDPRHRRRGASTISQQTVKNLFLWPGGYLRKGIEAVLTLLAERIWGKDRILELYLNIVEFGPGIYGVEAASRSYFGKPAAALTADQAARLAAVLPNPRHWSVRNPGPYVQARVAWILGQMGYGSSSTPREEPEPPPSELQGAEDAPEIPPDAPPATPPPGSASEVPPPAPTAPPPSSPPPPSPPPDAAPPAAAAPPDQPPPAPAAAPGTPPN